MELTRLLLGFKTLEELKMFLNFFLFCVCILEYMYLYYMPEEI